MNQEGYWKIGNRFAIEWLRAIMWINGAAAVVAMTTNNTVSALVFAAGVVFAAATFLFGYLANLYYGNAVVSQDQGQYQDAVNFHYTSFVAVAGALVCFWLGVVLYG